MHVETPEDGKKLDPKTPEYWAERRRRRKPALRVAVLFSTVDLLLLAGLWTYAVYSGVRGTAALVGGILVTLFQLLNVRETFVGESRVGLVSEVIFLVAMGVNSTLTRSHPEFTPTPALVVLFVGIVVIDFGLWALPFRGRLQPK